MFRQTVRDTALTTDIANAYFQEIITGGEYYSDYSFVSTLRALIAPRMEQGEKLHLSFHTTSYDADAATSNSRSQFIKRHLCRYFGTGDTGRIYIHSMSGADDDNQVCMQTVQSYFSRVFPGWQRLPRVTDLFRTQFNTLCFINPEIKSVIVFVDNLNTSKLHYLQCAILGFFPWYFNPERGITQDEMNLINSLRGKDVDVYQECIRKLAEQYDFRTSRIRQLLSNFETRLECMQRDTKRREIESLEQNIQSLLRNIDDKMRLKNQYLTTLLGLETKIASQNGESEIMDYFICNKKLDLQYVDDSDIEFVARDYISYFDEDVARKVIDNRRSYVYNKSSYADYFSPEDMKKLMYAIFIDQTIKIRVCAAYRFELGVSVHAIQHYNFNKEYDGYMPNPHIQRYSCMGNYSSRINNAMQQNDYITAFEQSIASAKSINFSDSIVMESFMSDIYGVNFTEAQREKSRWFELPNGIMANTKEAIDWVLSQESNQ